VRVALTPKMAELRNFIASFEDKHGFGPSYDEMQTAMGLSARSRVHALVTSLEQRGAVRRKPHVARSVTAMPDMTESLSIAREHVAYCIKSGMGLRQILEAIFHRSPASTSLTYAIEQVAVAWERMQEGVGQ
jgi:SOS-response transcriptional repressor LexA